MLGEFYLSGRLNFISVFIQSARDIRIYYGKNNNARGDFPGIVGRDGK
jgi:hypothetical protein